MANELVKLSKEVSIENSQVSPTDFDRYKQKTDWLIWIMAGFIVVVFFGLMGMAFTLAGIITDSWRYNVNSYIDYQATSKQYDEKNHQLNQQIIQLQQSVTNLNTKLDRLEIGSINK